MREDPWLQPLSIPLARNEICILQGFPLKGNDDIFSAVGSFNFRPATEAECNRKTQIMEHVHIRLDLLSEVSTSKFSHCSCALKTYPIYSKHQVPRRFPSFFGGYGLPLKMKNPRNRPVSWIHRLLQHGDSATQLSPFGKKGFTGFAACRPTGKKKCERFVQGNTPNRHLYTHIYLRRWGTKVSLQTTALLQRAHAQPIAVHIKIVN